LIGSAGALNRPGITTTEGQTDMSQHGFEFASNNHFSWTDISNTFDQENTAANGAASVAAGGDISGSTVTTGTGDAVGTGAAAGEYNVTGSGNALGDGSAAGNGNAVANGAGSTIGNGN
jgi:hypothetical protein